MWKKTGCVPAVLWYRTKSPRQSLWDQEFIWVSEAPIHSRGTSWEVLFHPPASTLIHNYRMIVFGVSSWINCFCPLHFYEVGVHSRILSFAFIRMLSAVRTTSLSLSQLPLPSLSSQHSTKAISQPNTLGVVGLVGRYVLYLHGMRKSNVTRDVRDSLVSIETSLVQKRKKKSSSQLQSTQREGTSAHDQSPLKKFHAIELQTVRNVENSSIPALKNPKEIIYWFILSSEDLFPL